MENFEPLNAIVDEFAVKTTTLAIFNLLDLHEQGKMYQVPNDSKLPSYNHPLSVTHDTEDSSFCSIFSDQPGNTQADSTQLSVFDSSHAKLKSDHDVLSSEFEIDILQPILTSDATQ